MNAAAATDAAVGLTWIPYLVAGLALVALAVYARFRSRTRGSAPLAEFLLIRGGALLVIGVTVLLLADAASDGDGLTAVDRPVWSWFVEQRTGWLTVAFTAVTQVGGTIGMAVIAIVAAARLWKRRRGDAILVVTVAVGAGLLVSISKPIIGRVRPPEAFRLATETNASFPSGHALGSMAILGVLALVFVPRTAGRRVRFVGYGLVTLLILLIGISRLYLGVHWTTDIAGGWLTGLGWLLLCLTVRRLWRTYPVLLRLGRRTLVDHRPGNRQRPDHREDLEVVRGHGKSIT